VCLPDTSERPGGVLVERAFVVLQHGTLQYLREHTHIGQGEVETLGCAFLIYTDDGIHENASALSAIISRVTVRFDGVLGGTSTPWEQAGDVSVSQTARTSMTHVRVADGRNKRAGYLRITAGSPRRRPYCLRLFDNGFRHLEPSVPDRHQRCVGRRSPCIRPPLCTSASPAYGDPKPTRHPHEKGNQ
jgi:hypothetical protein